VRQPRQRIFDITVNGTKSWRENAGNRVAIEVQHELAQETGKSVHVTEKYIGGARATKRDDEAEE